MGILCIKKKIVIIFFFHINYDNRMVLVKIDYDYKLCNPHYHFYTLLMII